MVYMRNNFIARGTLNQRMSIFIEMLAANLHKTCGDSF